MYVSHLRFADGQTKPRSMFNEHVLSEPIAICGAVLEVVQKFVYLRQTFHLGRNNGWQELDACSRRSSGWREIGEAYIQQWTVVG
jgi:hypothetical protein